MSLLNLLVPFSLLASPVTLQTPKNMTFSTKLKSVAVFRDNFGYYVREGRVKLENGWATTDMVPAAVKGTVRFFTLDKGDKIDQVVIAKDNNVEFTSTDDLKKKLADKIGLRIVVVTKSGQRHEAELSRVLDDMLLLKVGDSFVGVPFGSIRSVSLSGFPVKIKVQSSDPNKVVGIGVAYLQEGISWDPSYVLDINNGTGALSLRASMKNTAEKIADSDVFFVVGSPFVTNRGVGDMLAPMAISAEVPKKADEKDPAEMARREEAEREAAERGNVQNAAVTREEAGELYYYKKPGLSLDKEDVAQVAIFDVTVPVKPTYEWNADGEEVSYLVSLTNKSTQPLTTGPVFVLEDGRAIGQEQVKYTPAGATTEIRLSRGIGLKVEKQEAEAKRLAPVTVGKTDYIPVQLKGTLTITNHKAQAATVKVLKTVRGRVDKLSDDGKVKQTQILNGEPNPINDLQWNVTVPAGATKTITYTFETYMSAERAGSPPVPVRDGNDD